MKHILACSKQQRFAPRRAASFDEKTDQVFDWKEEDHNAKIDWIEDH